MSTSEEDDTTLDASLIDGWKCILFPASPASSVSVKHLSGAVTNNLAFLHLKYKFVL